ncbi:GNAT family N-acetyltransferase [Actinomycetaceae bacterium L2_0104]
MRVTEVPIPLFPGDDPMGQFEALEELNRARYEAGLSNSSTLRTGREISASYSRRVIFTRHYYLLTDPAESNFDAPIAMIAPGSPAKILGYGYVRLAQQHKERGEAWCDVVVHPESWGKGYGSFLLDEVTRAARAKGARQLTCRAYAPLESRLPTVSEFAEYPVPRFLIRKGFSLSNVFEDYVWDVSDPQALRERLEPFTEVPGYRLVSWEGLTPSELLPGMADIRRNYTMDEQQAAFEQSRTEYWTPESLAREDQYNVSGGAPSFTTAALDQKGEIAGFTSLISHVDSPNRLLQSGTVVRMGARGKGLGMALKAANILSVQRRHPMVRTVTVGIDPANIELVAVNERLGYERVGMQGEFSKRI